MKGMLATSLLAFALLTVPTRADAFHEDTPIVSVHKAECSRVAVADRLFDEAVDIASLEPTGMLLSVCAARQRHADRELSGAAHRIMATPETYPMTPSAYRYGLSLTLWKRPHDVSRGEVAKRYGVDHGSGERDLALLSRWLMS